ncbi:MAG: PriCT-2 domain-containing protein [bacterium]
MDELLGIIDISYLTEYNSWRNIGTGLKSILEIEDLNSNEEDLIILWRKHSQRAPNYEERALISQWKAWDPTKMGIQIIYYYAKISDISGYNKILLVNNIDNLFSRPFQWNDLELSEYLLPLFKPIYRIMSANKSEVAFYYNGKYWEEYSNPKIPIIPTFKKFNKLLAEKMTYYKQIISNMTEQMADIENASDEYLTRDLSFKTKLFKNLEKLHGSLNKPKIESYFGLMKMDLMDPSFSSKLDTNMELICFENGVFDRKEGKFRVHKSTDLCKNHCDYEFIPFDKIDKKEIDKFKTFMGNFCRDDEEGKLQYIIDVLSSVIWGNRDTQGMYVLYGGGENGKSVFTEFLQYLVGGNTNYSVILRPHLLSSKAGTTKGANEDAYSLIGKRIAVIQEPDDEAISAHKLKQYASSDFIAARDLFKSLEYFKAVHTLFYSTNHPLTVSDSSRGTRRRINYITFNIKFVPKNTKNLSKNERYQDPKIKDKLTDKRFLSHVMSFLIKNFIDRVSKYGLIEPNCVVKENENIKTRSNIFLNYINNHLEPIKSKGKGIKIKEFNKRFKDWCVLNDIRKFPSDIEINSYFYSEYNHKVYDSENNVLYYHKMVEPKTNSGSENDDDTEENIDDIEDIDDMEDLSDTEGNEMKEKKGKNKGKAKNLRQF